MYSQPWSPTPSTTAVAPELRTAKRSPAMPLRKLRRWLRRRDDVADEDAFFGQEAGGLGRIGDDAAAGEAFAEIVVGVAFEFERDAVGNECAEALAGRAVNLKWMVPSGNPAEP
jgi:hypothetical protein